MSVFDGCLRGHGSASLAEVLNGQAQLEIPAACASQGVIEHLWNREFPRQFDRISPFFREVLGPSL